MCQFLDLPPELRTMIYKEVFTSYTPAAASAGYRQLSNAKASENMGILATCRQIYYEAAWLAFSRLVFVVADLSTLPARITQVRPDLKDAIQRVAYQRSASVETIVESAQALDSLREIVVLTPEQTVSADATFDVTPTAASSTMQSENTATTTTTTTTTTPITAEAERLLHMKKLMHTQAGQHSTVWKKRPKRLEPVGDKFKDLDALSLSWDRWDFEMEASSPTKFTLRNTVPERQITWIAGFTNFQSSSNRVAAC